MDSLLDPARQESFAFEGFQLFPAARLLTRGSVNIRVGSRSLDILIALVAQAGEIMGKDDLIAAVWPDTIVEESALRVHISTLRKALGDGEGELRLIANVPGRGYSFVAPVTLLGSHSASTAQPVTTRRSASRLPATLTKIIGRTEVVNEVSRSIMDRRLVSIVGPGGMGKTTVALAVARSLSADPGHEVAFVDLGQIGDPTLVSGAVATALGLPVRSSDVIDDIVAAVSGRRLLLLFDSCEHLVDAAADLAEKLLGMAPDLKILATSREALRAEGEWVHRLKSLELPPHSITPTAIEALDFPAVELFVERASAVLGGYRLMDAQAPLVADICRRLDGIALAIELATGRLDGMSVEALAASLDDRFQILTRGRRTALPRHQTLRGAIDWSYGILSIGEQTALQRLSVFVGPFTLQAARSVVAGGDLTAAAIDEILLNLVAKSLVTADAQGGDARYRLLDTMRAYAGEKLQDADDTQRVRRIHAVFFRDLLSGTDTNWTARSAAEWTTENGGQLANLRAAIDWAFAEQGDGAIGVALTVNAIPLWFQLSLVDECIGRVQCALTWLETSPDPHPRARMQLYAGLGFPQMRGVAGFPSGAAAWRTALAIAEEIGDLDYQGRSLWALWTDRVNSGEAREAMDFASCFAELAETYPAGADPLIAERMRARSELLLGEPDEAHRRVTAMLIQYEPQNGRTDVARFQYDQRSVARVTLARALWLKGFADQALNEVENNLALVAATGHILSLAHVLSDAACFIALWRGDLDLAERYVASLRLHTSLQALDVWHMYGDCFEAEIRIRRGDTKRGIEQLRAGIDTLHRAGFVCYHTAFVGVLAESLRASRQPGLALASVDEALAVCARTGEAWCMAELKRIRADILLDLGDVDEAEQVYDSSFVLAQSQGARAWELRTAISWARAARTENQAKQGAQRLRTVLDRSTEGFDTVDFNAAVSLLAALG
ncbi:helix-turn-helix transcriptional regulator [Sphingosinicellaceae bacterium]|nr:helix-turn-helix transcriptional regulator [Sphingosinicellaceae bacterium]